MNLTDWEEGRKAYLLSVLSPAQGQLPMCCCMLLSVLIKLYTFLHNNSFCNTFGANVYSHPVPVNIIKLL